MPTSRVAARRNSPTLLGTFIILVVLTGCASSGGSNGGSDRNLITREQIAELDVTTAYDAIERLRPRWLRAPLERSHNRPTQVVVLVDNLQLEGIASLRDIDAANIASIRWLDSAQAGQLAGLGSMHVEGAIVIETY